MNLESQVVSLELAKRLKELEVKQDSLFYWVETRTNPKFIIAHTNEYHKKSYNLDQYENG